eukprot:gene11009-3715_t
MWHLLKVDPEMIELSRHTSVTYKDEIFIYGGYKKSNDEFEVEENNLMYKMSLKSKKCSKIVSPHLGRCGHTACIYKDSMFIFGGLTLISYLNDLYEYNFTSKEWSLRRYSGRIEKRFAHSSTIVKEKMLIFGGITDGSQVGEDYQILNDLYEYDFEKNEIRECFITQTDISPICGQAVLTYKNEMIMFGGLFGKNKRSNEIYKIKPNKKSYSLTMLPKNGDVPSERAGSTMVEFDDNLYITGGYNGDIALDDIYQYSFKQKKWKLIELKLPIGLRLHSTNLIKTDVSNDLITFGGSGSENGFIYTSQARVHSKIYYDSVKEDGVILKIECAHF